MSFYNYVPSLLASITFAGLFIFATLALIILLVLNLLKNIKSWTTVPLILGCLFEFVGYLIRYMSSKNTNSLGLYVSQLVFILISPCVWTLFLYIVFAEIVNVIDAHMYCVIPVKSTRLAIIVIGTVTIIMQSLGGSLRAQNSTTLITVGNVFVFTGLAIQLMFLVVFIFVAALFQLRIIHVPTIHAFQYRQKPSKFRNWQNILAIVLISSLLFLVRTVVRIVEFSQHSKGSVISSEFYLYLFDGALMILVVIMFTSQDIGATLSYIREDIKPLTSMTIEMEPELNWEYSREFQFKANKYDF